MNKTVALILLLLLSILFVSCANAKQTTDVNDIESEWLSIECRTPSDLYRVFSRTDEIKKASGHKELAAVFADREIIGLSGRYACTGPSLLADSLVKLEQADVRIPTVSADKMKYFSFRIYYEGGFAVETIETEDVSCSLYYYFDPDNAYFSDNSKELLKKGDLTDYYLSDEDCSYEGETELLGSKTKVFSRKSDYGKYCTTNYFQIDGITVRAEFRNTDDRFGAGLSDCSFDGLRWIKIKDLEDSVDEYDEWYDRQLTLEAEEKAEHKRQIEEQKEKEKRAAESEWERRVLEAVEKGYIVIVDSLPVEPEPRDTLGDMTFEVK